MAIQIFPRPQSYKAEKAPKILASHGGIEFIETMTFIPLWLLERLIEFDADGDPDLETQCEDEGAACEDEGAQCDTDYD